MSTTPDPANPSLESLLCFAVYSADLAFGRVYRPLLEASGLTYVQYVVMVTLWERENRTVGDLCGSLFLTTSTLTPVLQKLERKGLVRRHRGPGDEREVHVRLTDAGRELRHKTRALPDCIRTLTGLDPATVGELSSAIASLRDRLLAISAVEASPHPARRRRAPPPLLQGKDGSTRMRRRISRQS